MDISFFLVISACLELEIEMFIFFHILIKVEQIVIQLIRMHIVFYSAC